MAGNNQGLFAFNAVLLNNTISNNICPKTWPTAKGAGVYLDGPRAVLFNNTIQANEVCPGDKGDNIMLKSKEGNQFTVQYNNLGNSNGDGIDLYLDTVILSCYCLNGCLHLQQSHIFRHSLIHDVWSHFHL